MPDSETPETEPIVLRLAGSIEDGVKAAVGAVGRRLDELPRTRTRRLRRLARHPLPYLFEVYPEARLASRRETGIQTIALEDLGGTAVGPSGQRGLDFLPLKPFRSRNWSERWRRLRAATDRLATLPPIDVQRFAGRFWVVDGHNRVAAALYVGQLEIDANVLELVAADETPSGTTASLAGVLEEHAQLLTVLSRRTVDDAPDDPG